jgi:hypothetical protein
MLIDLTLTGPGLFDLKNLFDYSRELDVRIETKRMFAFHPDIVFSPMSWPRHILDRIVKDILDYIEPRATHKQETLVRELKSLLVTPTFKEQWPDRADLEFFKGRNWQDKIADIRKNETDIRIEDIYSADSELYDWWMRLPNFIPDIKQL